MNIWRVSVHEEPDDREVAGVDCASFAAALHVADTMLDPAYSNRYLRFRTPADATTGEIEALQQLGLVNGEAVPRD